MPSPWTREEVEATVADYLAMLRVEVAGGRYSKTAHRRLLAPLLNSRSDPAIERKHMNISAVLLEHGLRPIEGYKPLGNYQELLAEVVMSQVESDAALLSSLAAEVDAPAVLPSVEDILGALEEPPEPTPPSPYPRPVPVFERPPNSSIDFLAREARNRDLGSKGEEFAMRCEQARLIGAGKANLADRVERVSQTQGDWLGFDIHSYEADGSDRFLEVKTTRYVKETPFYVSRNEVDVSVQRAERYHLCRVFKFRADRRPGLFLLPGSLDQSCRLDPVSYMARVGGA